MFYCPEPRTFYWQCISCNNMHFHRRAHAPPPFPIKQARVSVALNAPPLSHPSTTQKHSKYCAPCTYFAKQQGQLPIRCNTTLSPNINHCARAPGTKEVATRMINYFYTIVLHTWWQIWFQLPMLGAIPLRPIQATGAGLAISVSRCKHKGNK